MQQFQRLSRELLFRNPYWQYFRDSYIQPSGKVGEYHFIRTPGSVIVIPILAENTFLMVKQFRYINQRLSIEFPGGGCQEELSVEESARHELESETGFSAGQLRCIGQFNPCNGILDEFCSVFIATDIAQNATRFADESEDFEVLTVTDTQFRQLIRSGGIWDGMTLSAYLLYILYR